MTDNDFPPEALRIIEAAVGSVDHVEILRLIATNPAKPVDTDALSGELRIDKRVVREAAEDFVAAGILREVQGGYEYSPTPRDQDAISALVELYNTRPVTLIRVIYARPKPVKAFAEAFRIRRKD